MWTIIHNDYFLDSSQDTPWFVFRVGIIELKSLILQYKTLSLKIMKTCCHTYFLFCYCTASFCEISNRLKPCEKFSNTNTFSWYQNIIYIVKSLIIGLDKLLGYPTHIQIYVICLFTFLQLYLTFSNSTVENQEETKVTNTFLKIISIFFFYWNEILWCCLNLNMLFLSHHFSFSMTRWPQYFSIN